MKIERLTVGRKHGKAFVVDDIVDPDALAQLYRHFKTMPFSFNHADHRASNYALHFVHHLTRPVWEADLVVRRYLAIVAAVLHRDGLRHRRVDRVYVNATLFGDYNFHHRDGCDWTALAFVNDTWQDHWGGELMLYRDADIDAPAIAIRPKPGRMVIFDGRMVHRPGTPTKYCLEPRITLVCKIGEGQLGKRKRRR